MSYDRREEDVYTFWALIFLSYNPSFLPSSILPSVQLHWPGLEARLQEDCPAGNVPLKNCWFGYCFYLHHISSEYYWIILFCLKSLLPQESGWPPSCGPGQCLARLYHCQHGVLSMSMMQFFNSLGVGKFTVGCIEIASQSLFWS